MVIIELYKLRATHMKYMRENEGKWEVFQIEND